MKKTEGFIPEKLTPASAVLELMDLSRNSISPEWAKDITEAFGCKLDKGLIRTGKGYRELVRDNEEKVTVSALAESICEQLGIEPDKQLMETANMMFGVGRMHELSTKACCKSLKQHFKLEVPDDKDF